MRYKIADLVIEIDCDKVYLSDRLKAFEYKGLEEPELLWKVKDHNFPQQPELIDWINFSGFSVGRLDDKVYVSYFEKDMYLIRWIIYENNFSKATFYFSKESIHKLNYAPEEYLFSFFQEAFFLGVLYHDGISIHSASIIYREKGVVFSAPSQTGKSTHTNLWNKIYATPILDGDVTVCRYCEDGMFIYGLPWCGTSGLFLNQKIPLEALVFLRQGLCNKVTKVPVYEAFQQLFSRSFTPLWDAVLMEQRVRVTEKILGQIPQIYELECLPNAEAVEVMKEAIEQGLNSK